MKQPNLFFVTSKIPHQHSGATATILRNLLDNLAPESVFVMGSRGRYWLDKHLSYKTLQLPALPSRWARFSHWSLVPYGVIKGVNAARRFNADVIVVTFPLDSTLLIGYLIHRWTGIPIVIYQTDLYKEAGAWFKSLAAWLQPRAFNHAKSVISINDGMSKYYKEKYDLNSPVVPVCLNKIIPEHYVNSITNNNRFVIGYSGHINWGRIDGIKVLVDAIGDDSSYEIRLFSGTLNVKKGLSLIGAWRDSILLQHHERQEDLLNALAKCDAVYMPLTFKTDVVSRDQLSTAFGIKSYEYMISGRPILVMCPPDYFNARFFAEKDAAALVPEPNPVLLRQTLEQLRTDKALRERLSRNAFEAAKEFEGSKVSKHFIEIVTEAVNQTFHGNS